MNHSRHIAIVATLIAASTTQLFADEHHTSNSNSITHQQVVPGIHMIQAGGGNIAISTGKDGVLMVDAEFRKTSEQLDRVVTELGGNSPRFILNTHWHGDHTGGNVYFGKKAHIVAHTNVRKRMSTRQEVKAFNMVQEPQPPVALPVITFDASLSLHFNDLDIRAIHFPGGHTDGDSVVVFQGAGVAHVGDLYFAGMFPFVDLGTGGNALRVAKNVAQLIEQLPENTKIIPGHGPLSSMSDFRAYHKMLTGTIEHVQKKKQRGTTLSEVITAGLPATWDTWTKGFLTTEQWLTIVYNSLP